MKKDDSCNLDESFALHCTDYFLFAQSPCTLVHKDAHGNLPH